MRLNRTNSKTGKKKFMCGTSFFDSKLKKILEFLCNKNTFITAQI